VTLTLVSISLIAVYSAMAVYTVAFIAFTVDLAKRSAVTPAAEQVVATGAAGRATALLEKVVTEAPAGRSRALRIAMALTAVGWALHTAAVVTRGLAAGRVPWANMFEFSLTGTALITLIFLLVQFWQNLKFLGVFITGLTIILLGIATVNYWVPVVPLQPALQSYWLVIHVFVAIAGTGFFALGAGLAVAQLVQTYRQGRTATGKLRFMATLPDADRLEVLTYRVLLVGFVLWTFTLIAGAIWAERAWGRYWGWDTKEVWTFIIWVVYAGYIHARATRGWRGARSSWLALIGFAAVMFNFSVVNVFFKGLHSYSGL